MHTSEVNEMNAYRFSDNWQIVKENTDDCVGCEHNQTEAKAIAAYLSNYHGNKYTVRHNRIDLVRRALELRDGDVFRLKNREMILESMRVGK